MQIRRRHIQGQAVYWGDAGPGRYRRGVLNCFQLKTMLLWCVLEFLDRNKFEASKNGNILFDEMFSCGCPTGSEGCSPAKWKKGRSQCNNSWPRHWRESKLSNSRKMGVAWPKNTTIIKIRKILESRKGTPFEIIGQGRHWQQFSISKCLAKI